jgi:hypothetical protein
MSLKDILSKLPGLTPEELDVVVAAASAMRTALSGASNQRTSSGTRGRVSGKSRNSNTRVAPPVKGRGATSASKASRGGKKKGPAQPRSNFQGVPEFEVYKASNRIVKAALKRLGNLSLREAEELCANEGKVEPDSPAGLKLTQAGLESGIVAEELSPILSSFRAALESWFRFKSNLEAPAAPENQEQSEEEVEEQA